MSVVGLTFGSAANAIRPSVANAASVADQRDGPRVGLASARTRRSPRPARAAQDRERAELPAHRRHSRAPRARERLLGREAPPVPPRMRAVSVAKYQPAGEHLGARRVGDRPRRRRAGPRASANAAANSGSWVATTTPRASSAREQLGELRPSRAVHAAGRLIEHRRRLASDRRARSRARAAGSRRRTVARVAIGSRGRGPTARERRCAELVADAVVDEVVARVLEQQRDAARRLDLAAGRARAARRRGAAASTCRRRCAPAARRARRARSRARRRRGSRGRRRSSCQTPRRSAARGSPRSRRAGGAGCGALRRRVGSRPAARSVARAA